ncbi:MAG TPA: DUF6541 family protein, partial [Pseudonocardiaceae bacterium]|nr:DUF6541 family protein [Pseudonocardiaceae bacterium]
ATAGPSGRPMARWRSGSVLLMLLVVLVVLAVLPLTRWLVGDWWPRAGRGGTDRAGLPAWTTAAHVAVALATAAGGLLGGAVLLTAFGGMASVPQDWDAMLHANGVRHIAETGDSGVYDLYTVNAFASDGQIYYPNAYHLVGALVYELTGAGIPEVLNAQSLLLPLMLALGLVAVVRAFHGRAALAVFAALVAPMATAMPYDLIWRGPLLPFATAVVLTLAMMVALRFYLDRPSPGSAIPLILAAAGLLGLHPSMLAGAALFALPLLVQRWCSGAGLRRSAVELGALVAAGVAGAALALPALVGALSIADAVLGFTWPQPLTPAQAMGEVLGFSTAQSTPQYLLLLALAIGAFGFRSLGQLRWLPVAGVVFGGLFVLSAAYDTEWAHLITSVWWNDMHRLAGIAAMALLPLVAHGLVRSYDLLLERVLRPAFSRLDRPLGRALGRPHPLWAMTSLAVVLAGFLWATGLGYAQRNIERTERTYGPGHTVGEAEIRAFQVLEKLVQPGERVMNDRFDGSGWMYALTGVKPVAAHFGATSIGVRPELLAMAFDEYDFNPAVRAAAAELNVRWVIVAPGFIRGDQMRRQPGLDQLEQVSALQLVYDRDGVRIYELGQAPESAETPAPVADVDVPDGDVPDGDVADGDVPDGDMADGDTVGGAPATHG